MVQACPICSRPALPAGPLRAWLRAHLRLLPVSRRLVGLGRAHAASGSPPSAVATAFTP